MACALVRNQFHATEAGVAGSPNARHPRVNYSHVVFHHERSGSHLRTPLPTQRYAVANEVIGEGFDVDGVEGFVGLGPTSDVSLKVSSLLEGGDHLGPGEFPADTRDGVVFITTETCAWGTALTFDVEVAFHTSHLADQTRAGAPFWASVGSDIGVVAMDWAPKVEIHSLPKVRDDHPIGKRVLDG